MFSFGGHATALYNAEAAKSQVWKPARASALAGALLGAFIATPQQAYGDVAARIFAPAVSGHTSRVLPAVRLSPQSVDLSLQPFFDAPQVGLISGTALSASYLFGTHAATLYNAEAQKARVWSSAAGSTVVTGKLGQWMTSAGQLIDLTLQPFFDAPQPLGALPRIAAQLRVAPQAVDLSLQPFFDGPQPAPGVVSGPAPTAQYQFGTHAVALYNAEAEKTRIWSSIPAPTSVTTGILGQWTTSAPQAADLSLQPFFDGPQSNPSGYLFTVIGASPDTSEFPTLQPTFVRSSIQGLVSGILGAFSRAPPQLEERPTFTVWPSVVSGATPRIVPTTWTPEQSYTNPQPLGIRASTPIGGPALGSVAVAPQQSYSDVQPRITPAVIAGNSPRIGVFFTAAQIDATQATPRFTAPITATAVVSVPVAPYLATSQQAQDYPTLQIWSSRNAGVNSRVAPLVQSAAQADLTQQPFFDAPQPGPLTGLVPPAVRVPPQQVDLTLQATFSHPLITGQGKLGSFSIAPPQQFDYTLQGNFASPLSAAIVYTILAPERLGLDDYGQRISLDDYSKRLII